MKNNTRTNARRGKKLRDKKGRFLPGTSGNPRGRPVKKQPLPRPLVEELAHALCRGVNIPDKNGKQRLLTIYQGLVLEMIYSFREAKPKEKLDLLVKLDQLGVFSTMHSIAEGEEELFKFSEEDREMILEAAKELGLDPHGKPFHWDRPVRDLTEAERRILED